MCVFAFMGELICCLSSCLFLGTPWNHNEGGKCDFRKLPRWVVMTIAPHLSKGSRGWRPKIRPAEKICQLSSWFWAHLSVEVGSWWDWNCSTTWSADPLKLSIRDKAAAVINFTPAVVALDLHTWTLGGLDIGGSIGKRMTFRAFERFHWKVKVLQELWFQLQGERWKDCPCKFNQHWLGPSQL